MQVKKVEKLHKFYYAKLPPALDFYIQIVYNVTVTTKDKLKFFEKGYFNGAFKKFV